LKVPS